jgi:hypothetical protein
MPTFRMINGRLPETSTAESTQHAMMKNAYISVYRKFYWEFWEHITSKTKMCRLET